MPVQYEPWSVQNEKLDQWGFRILEGKFNGTLIGITSLELEDNSNELKLDFDFIEKTSGIEGTEYSSKEFNTIMENIINDILFKAMDEYKNRNGDTAESS